MNEARNGRAMQPRPQQGTSLLVALTVHATDEGVYIARLAWKDPDHGRVLVQYGEKKMWLGGIADVQDFAADVAGNLMDKMEWTLA